jgi:hypothetical protein
LFSHHVNVEISVVHHPLSKIRGSQTEFMTQCVRLINLELTFSNTFSNAKITYITIVDLDESSKLGIREFQI